MPWAARAHPQVLTLGKPAAWPNMPLEPLCANPGGLGKDMEGDKEPDRSGASLVLARPRPPAGGPQLTSDPPPSVSPALNRHRPSSPRVSRWGSTREACRGPPCTDHGTGSPGPPSPRGQAVRPSRGAAPDSPGTAARRPWYSVTAKLRFRKGLSSTPPHRQPWAEPCHNRHSHSRARLHTWTQSSWPSADVINARSRAPCLSQKVP